MVKTVRYIAQFRRTDLFSIKPVTYWENFGLLESRLSEARKNKIEADRIHKKTRLIKRTITEEVIK